MSTYVQIYLRLTLQGGNFGTDALTISGMMQFDSGELERLGAPGSDS